MEFRTVYDRKRVQNEKVGSPVKKLFRGEYDSNGVLHLVENGEQDWYGMIQAGAESVDLNRIIDLYTRTGDTSVFMQRKGQYLDVTEFPKSYADILNVISRAQSHFEELPLSEREKYNHDFAQYFAALDKQMQAAVQTAVKVSNEVEKEEVKTDE